MSTVPAVDTVLVPVLHVLLAIPSALVASCPIPLCQLCICPVPIPYRVIMHYLLASSTSTDCSNVASIDDRADENVTGK